MQMLWTLWTYSFVHIICSEVQERVEGGEGAYLVKIYILIQTFSTVWKKKSEEQKMDQLRWGEGGFEIHLSLQSSEYMTHADKTQCALCATTNPIESNQTIRT